MQDPRVRRTRECVFAAVGRLLSEPSAEPLTVSRIAEAAGVARKTVYAHWPTVPAIVADVLLAEHAEPEGAVPASTEQATSAFLRGVRDAFTDPGIRAAMAFLIEAAPSDRAADDALRTVTARRAADLARIVGDEHAERLLAELTGPVFFAQFVAQVPATDAFIEQLAARVLADPGGAAG